MHNLVKYFFKIICNYLIKSAKVVQNFLTVFKIFEHGMMNRLLSNDASLATTNLTKIISPANLKIPSRTKMSTNSLTVAFQIISIMITDNLFCTGTTITTEHENVSDDSHLEKLFRAETVQTLPVIPPLVKEELLDYHNHVRRMEQASNMIELVCFSFLMR